MLDPIFVFVAVFMFFLLKEKMEMKAFVLFFLFNIVEYLYLWKFFGLPLTINTIVLYIILSEIFAYAYDYLVKLESKRLYMKLMKKHGGV